MSLGCSRPALNIPLGGRVYASGCSGGTFDTVVPAPRATCQPVMDWWLQVFSSAIVGAPAPVLAGAPAPFLVPYLALVLAPQSWIVLSCPPWPNRLA